MNQRMLSSFCHVRGAAAANRRRAAGMLHRFRHRIVGPMVIAWLLLTITGIAMRGVVWNRVTRSLDASEEATKLEGALNQVSSTLQDAENSQRNYLLTGNDADLKPFKAAETALSANFAQLTGA